MRLLRPYLETVHPHALLFHRHVVHIAMTVEAVGEFAQHLIVMRLAVAIGAGRQMPMVAMAGAAGYLAMAAGGLRPEPMDLAVAGGTGGGIFIAGQFDMHRHVRRMTLTTGAFLLLRQMWLMAVGAGGTLPMALAVTIGTGLLTMGARLLAQDTSYLRMALPAERLKGLGGREHKGRMGVLMTVIAGLEIRAMRQRQVTLPTVRHQLIIVVPPGIVGMKGLMTILAGKTMRPSLLPQIGKVAHMAAATLRSAHRLRHDGIEIDRFGPGGLFLADLIACCHHGASTQQQRRQKPWPEEPAFSLEDTVTSAKS
jgi:hypothetical protein